jgi:hypothetical protein
MRKTLDTTGMTRKEVLLAREAFEAGLLLEDAHHHRCAESVKWAKEQAAAYAPMPTVTIIKPTVEAFRGVEYRIHGEQIERRENISQRWTPIESSLLTYQLSYLELIIRLRKNPTTTTIEEIDSW